MTKLKLDAEEIAPDRFLKHTRDSRIVFVQLDISDKPKLLRSIVIKQDLCFRIYNSNKVLKNYISIQSIFVCSSNFFAVIKFMKSSTIDEVVDDSLHRALGCLQVSFMIPSRKMTNANWSIL